MDENDFNIVIYIKRLNFKVLDTLKLFPNREKILRDNLTSECFNILKYTYYANSLDLTDKNRFYYQDKVLIGIYMIDYYISIAYHYKYISEKRNKEINTLLREISRMTKGWISYGRSKSETSV